MAGVAVRSFASRYGLGLMSRSTSTSLPSSINAVKLGNQAFSANFSRSFCENPSDRKYAKSHEWVKVSGDIGTVGITKHAAELLGDIVYVDLPEVGSSMTATESFAAIESVKAASDIYAPVSGTVVEVNSALADTPETINSDAFEAGWIAKVQLSNPADTDELLDSKAYAAEIEE
mmetsp:Transcript_2872/g.5046  ORF Transcript_2872/g.5046 Transcript_2872/m.5046 type:complete len:175 (+) Transcript_2872:265-789(+)